MFPIHRFSLVTLLLYSPSLEELSIHKNQLSEVPTAISLLSRFSPKHSLVVVVVFVFVPVAIHLLSRLFSKHCLAPLLSSTFMFSAWRRSTWVTTWLSRWTAPTSLLWPNSTGSGDLNWMERRKYIGNAVELLCDCDAPPWQAVGEQVERDQGGGVCQPQQSQRPQPLP